MLEPTAKDREAARAKMLARKETQKALQQRAVAEAANKRMQLRKNNTAARLLQALWRGKQARAALPAQRPPVPVLEVTSSPKTYDDLVVAMAEEVLSREHREYQALEQQRREEERREWDRQEAERRESERAAADADFQRWVRQYHIDPHQTNQLGVPTASKHESMALADHLFGDELAANNLVLVGPLNLESTTGKCGMQYLVLRVEDSSKKADVGAAGTGEWYHAESHVGASPPLPSNSFRLLEIRDWPPTADELRHYGIHGVRQPICGAAGSGLASATASVGAQTPTRRPARPASAGGAGTRRLARSATSSHGNGQRGTRQGSGLGAGHGAGRGSPIQGNGHDRSLAPSRSAGTCPASRPSSAARPLTGSQPAAHPTGSQLTLRSYASAMTNERQEMSAGRLTVVPSASRSNLVIPTGGTLALRPRSAASTSSLASSVGSLGQSPWKGAIEGGTQMTLLKAIRRQQDGHFFCAPKLATPEWSRKEVAAIQGQLKAVGGKPIFHAPIRTACAYSGKTSAWNWC